MSEHSSPEERTEDPTDKRMSQIRREGAVHMSNDLVMVVSLLTGFLMLQAMWSWFLGIMSSVMVRSFSMISTPDALDEAAIQAGVLELLWLVVPPVLVLSVAVALAAALAVMLQTKWNIKPKVIDVKFSQLNPITGFMRLFSLSSFMNTLKALVKLCVILPIGFFGLKAYAPEMVMLMHLSIQEVFSYTGDAIMSLFWKVMYVLIALAIFDYFWGRYQWLRKNKMTRDEVKDEKKAVEGDEQTKRKIQAKGLQRIMQRIQSSIPQADVVVTNPTHYAVALKYDREHMSAPVVLAKGKGFLALRIRRLAKESGVPVLQRKVLARGLYHSTEVGSEIPYDLFRAVAEVLAYVYRLKNPQAYRSQGA